MSSDTPDSPLIARSQLDIYFAEVPTINFQELARFVNECDPSEESECTVLATAPSEDVAGGVERPVITGGGALTLGEFTVFLLVHDCPSLDVNSYTNPALSPAVRADFARQKAFVLATLMGGDEYEPIERMVFLLKIALGLLQQGGIGVGFPLTGIAIGAQGMMELAKLTMDELDVWQALREEYEPNQLLSAIGVIEQQGSQWMITRGHEFFGLPDMAFQLTNDKDVEEIQGMLKMCLWYMLQNGPVLEPGHTMGFDEKKLFRFAAPGPGESWLKERGHFLILCREEPKKKGFLKKLFGG